MDDGGTGEQSAHPCYIEGFPHALPHRAEAKLRPCGHWACDPHTITYYGRFDDDEDGGAPDERIGDYCMVWYERTFPGMCPDKALRAAIHGA
jgi:hypothetical protein